MESMKQPMLQSSQETKAVLRMSFLSFKVRILLLVIILVVAILSGVGGYLLGKNNQSNTEGDNVSSPVLPYTSSSSTSSQSSTHLAPCTSDAQCAHGYACQVTQGQATACPVERSVNGTVIKTVISCTPTYKIINGVCKLKKDEICSTNNDCVSGLICHAVQQGSTTVHKCEEPVLGSCNGSSDTSCPAGYQCTEGCGPPIIRMGDTTPAPWYCTAQEIANQHRACPVCLASNTMIATPNGEVNVKNISVGMQVWSINKQGKRIISTVLKISDTVVPSNHKVIHIVLDDGRNLWVSPNHPTSTGRVAGSLQVGEIYDNAKIVQTIVVPYWDTKTYDILPSSETGFYYANDILMGSTLK